MLQLFPGLTFFPCVKQHMWKLLGSVNPFRISVYVNILIQNLEDEAKVSIQSNLYIFSVEILHLSKEVAGGITVNIILSHHLSL